MDNKRMRTQLPETELLHILKAGMEYTGKSVLVIEAKTGTIVANNSSAEKIFGYEPGELLGLHVKQLDAESYIGIRKSMHERHQLGQCWDGEIQNRRKEGTMILTSVRSVSLGEHYLSFQEEITHRKYIEFFANVFFKDANTGFIIVDEALNIVKINNTALNMYPGKIEGNIEGHKLWEIDPGLRQDERYRSYLEVLETGRPFEINQIQFYDRWYKFKVFRINKIGLGIVSFDISEQVKAVQKAEEARCQLEDLNAFKDGILRNITHEFRTPLNGLNGFLEILSQSRDAETKELVECMKASAERLKDISDKFIDSQVIGNKKLSLTIERFSVKAFMSDIFSLLGHIAMKKQIDFILDIENDIEQIQTDKDYLSMIIMNLVSNAIKFSPKRSLIKVRVFRSGEYYQFQVIDPGIGIAMQDYERIFDSFYQVDFSATRRYEGVGLGLFNSRNYAGLLRGTIAVESVLGEGSIFTLSIPDLKQ